MTDTAGIISIKRYWGDMRHADLVLRLAPESLAGDGNPSDQERVDISIHSFAVAGISEWFRTRLEGAWGQSDAPKTPRTESDMEVDVHFRCVHDHFLPGEPATVPEAVLKHAYTNEPLPEDASTLVWMAKRADYWGIQCTLQACYQNLVNLSNAGKLGGDFIALSDNLPDFIVHQPMTWPNILDYKANVMGSVLSAYFKDTLAILNAPHLLAQFVQLPLTYLLLWLSGLRRGSHKPAVTVDHGNTIVLLVTAWYDKQPEPPTAEQCVQLTEAVNTDTLSLSFQLQALPHLAWWRTTGYSESVLKALRLMKVAADEDVDDDCGADVVRRYLAQYTSTPPSATLTHRLTASDMDKLWGLGWVECPNKVYYAGFVYSLGLQMRDVGLLDTLVEAGWHDVLIQHGVANKVPEVVTSLRLDITVGEVNTQVDLRLAGHENLALDSMEHYDTYEEMVQAFGSETPELSWQLSRPK